MRKTFLFFIVLFLLPISSVYSAFEFTRSLKLGDTGNDVLELQKRLNMDSDTAVALSGVGSRGKETNYFGNLTKSAVIKFQNKYRKDVLYPVGLISGTGYFGPSTMAKINTLSGIYTTNSESTNTDSTTRTIFTVEKPIPKITSVYPRSVSPGETITIYGENFTPTGNTVVLKYGLLEQVNQNVLSPDGRTLLVEYMAPGPSVSSEYFANLSGSAIASLEEAIKSYGLEISDISSYKGISNESELNAIMNKYGYSLKDLEDPYRVLVMNENGVSKEIDIIVKGMRRLQFNN